MLCRERQSNTTSDFYQGKPENRILVILESPGEAEIDLNRPAVGHTGGNLCRLFSSMANGCRCTDGQFYEGEFCIKNAMILNSTSSKGDVSVFLKGKNIVLAFGESAIKKYKRIKGHLPNHLLLWFCHIGTLGLGAIKDSKRGKISERDKIIMMCRWIDGHCNAYKNGFEMCSFEEFLNKEGLLWMPANGAEGVKAWMRRDYVYDKSGDGENVVRASEECGEHCLDAGISLC